jgi:hypothetical protein
MNQRMQFSAASEWLLNVATRNPEGLLLVAAGAVLLMRQGVLADRTGDRERLSKTDDPTTSVVDRTTDSVLKAADRVVSSASDYAQQAKRTAAEGSDRLLRQARSTYQGSKERVLRDNPLLVAIAGAAAGAALATAFPPSDLERQTIGPIGAHLTEAASDVSQQLKEAAGKAGEALMKTTDEHGLNSDGLKEVATDVAGAFSKGFLGEGGNGSSSVEKSPTPARPDTTG